MQAGVPRACTATASRVANEAAGVAGWGMVLVTRLGAEGRQQRHWGVENSGKIPGGGVGSLAVTRVSQVKPGFARGGAAIPGRQDGPAEPLPRTVEVPQEVVQAAVVGQGSRQIEVLIGRWS